MRLSFLVCVCVYVSWILDIGSIVLLVPVVVFIASAAATARSHILHCSDAHEIFNGLLKIRLSIFLSCVYMHVCAVVPLGAFFCVSFCVPILY